MRMANGMRASPICPATRKAPWWVQDFAASLPVKLLGDVAGKRVLDLCAAPGGKTAQLAAADAVVTAVDRSRDRMKRLEQNLARLALTAACVVADGATWDGAHDFDCVVIDAPCSATGTLRRHPDVAWLKDPRDLPKLNALQDRLIDAAAASGEARRHRDLLRLLAAARGRARRGSTRRSGAMRMWRDSRSPRVRCSGCRICSPSMAISAPCPAISPRRAGMDGFYAARLVKRAG